MWKSPWYVGCMCRETATPWSWAELGVGEPCLCTQHWTGGTQRPCLLLGRGGVFEGPQPAPASVSSAAHRHGSQGNEHDHVTKVHTAPAFAHVLSLGGGQLWSWQRLALLSPAVWGPSHRARSGFRSFHGSPVGRTPAAGTEPHLGRRLELHPPSVAWQMEGSGPPHPRLS